ncbi:MAG: LysM peptidoglycan-binding protein [Bacteroidetes bacterium]|nr:LysM peptidoglycan-binding protein [Bacteroidota bacterium]
MMRELKINKPVETPAPKTVVTDTASTTVNTPDTPPDARANQAANNFQKESANHLEDKKNKSADTKGTEPVTQAEEFDPADLMAMSGSVGTKGDNKEEDAKLVQSKLEELGLFVGPDDAKFSGTITAIKQFQSYVFTKGIPDGRIDVGGVTQSKLNETTPASFEKMKEEKAKRDNEKKKAEEKSKLEAGQKAANEKKAAEEKARASAAAVSDAQNLIKKYTDWGGLNLNEEGLGKELSGMVSSKPGTVIATIKALDSSDRDDVISAMMDSMSTIALLKADKDLLQVMHAELSSGVVMGNEILQIQKLRIILGLDKKKETGAGSTVPDTIDLVLPVDSWMSQFSYSKDQKVNRTACKATCDLILKNSGVKAPGAGARIYTAAENEDHTAINLTKDAKAGVAKIDEYLMAGKPMMVGVDHKLDYGYNEGTTDHFIIIVAKGKDATGVYYRFFDVGTSHKDKGTSKDNKLYLDGSGGLIGTTKYNGSKYTVSQVRPNE